MKYIIPILVFLSTAICHAQKTFTTHIRFPETVDTRKIIIIEYDDGKVPREVAASFSNNEATISGTFYSKYATLTIRYLYVPMRFHWNDYF